MPELSDPVEIEDPQKTKEKTGQTEKNQPQFKKPPRGTEKKPNKKRGR